MWKRLLIPGIFAMQLLCPATASGQAALFNNQRSAVLPVSDSLLRPDSLLLIPDSVRLYRTDTQSPLPPAWFQALPQGIQLLEPALLSGIDSVRIEYRVLPYRFDTPLLRIDTTDLQQAGVGGLKPGAAPGLLYNPFEDNEGLVDFGGLQYNGSFARGVSFGNNQNLVLNSSLNLQLAGELGDGIEVLAAISDENIPLQPEGNTQQLSEFDRIFVQLSKGDSRLIAGDYELARPNSYFMNYFKKLQGATYEQSLKLGEEGQLKTRTSIAIDRGKFGRNVLLGQEGNQGPYRLTGAEGERFIIVMAGTEKVYIDGELLKRGLEDDYVIDYNRGDLTFTNRRLITKDSRIIIEFEYNAQAYQRSLYAASAEYTQPGLRSYLHLYSEQDSKSNTGPNALSDAERQALRDAGDAAQAAIVSGIDTVGTNSDPITYRLIDTLVGGVLYPGVLVHQPTNPGDVPLYTARFSFLGPGQGNYIRPPSDANGFVYVWVAPDPLSGPQGDYEPVRQLVAPRQQQMYTAGLEWDALPGGILRTEVAMSRFDQNRFSPLDRDDDLGIAAFVGYQQDVKLPGNWGLRGQLSYEGVQDRFEDLNPYRNAEFLRDWNLEEAERAHEHLGRAQIGLRNDSLGLLLDYQYTGFLREQQYTGQRHRFDGAWRSGAWEAMAQADLVLTDGELEQTRFSRPKFSLSRSFPKLGGWKTGVYGERERNSRTSDELLGINSFFYDLYRAFLETPSSEKFNARISATRRDDLLPSDNEFSLNSRASELRLEGQWQRRWGRNNNTRIAWDMHYRNLELRDTLQQGLESGDTYLGRLDYSITLAKGALAYNSSYQLGAGQEQRVLFIFREVNRGEGVYQHIDFNGDGIQQNNEFVIAPNPDEATHVRIIVYTNEFIRTNDVQLNQSLRLEPRAVWNSSTGLKKGLSRFSTISTWQTNRRVRPSDQVSAWNPFQLDIADTSLIATRTLVQNSLFFNRLNPVYELQLSWTENASKQLLTTGFESRRNQEYGFRSRVNFGQVFSLQTLLSTGNRSNELESFADRTFVIGFYKAEPQLTWLPSQKIRGILRYRFEIAENDEAFGGEQSRFHDIQLEGTFNQSAATSLRTQFSYVQVQFDGEANSAVGFAFLNGLQNGNNYIWSFTLDRQLARNVRMGLSYEGRKTGLAPVVHVGRAQVAATF
jgi:hypothetical protein